MGVTGLWGCVDSSGHPISLETLNSKVISIDLSLWVNQWIKGYRGRNGQSVDNAHILGLFHRICKLLSYKIKPVFVFDGNCPQLKRNTIAKRQQQREKAINKSRESSVKVLQKFIASQLKSSDNYLPNNQSLPSLQSSLIQISDNKGLEIYEELNELQTNKALVEDSDESESESQSNIANKYKKLQNIDSIDMNSEVFNALPPDVKYEILTELKLKFKGYRNTDIMPKDSNDFSAFQVNRLLKKRSLQSKIEDTICQLNGQHSDDIIKQFSQKNVGFSSQSNAGRLMSDESTRYIFLKKSQTNSLQISYESNCSQKSELNTSEDIASTSLPKINDSNDSSCVVVSDSSESDSEVVLTNSAINTETIHQNRDNCLQFNDNSIVISDESDVEEEEDIETKIKSILNNTNNDCNEFTKIKTIEVNSDSDTDDSDTDDFVEVCPQTPGSLENLMKDFIDNDLLKQMSCELNDNIISDKVVNDILEPTVLKGSDFEVINCRNETKSDENIIKVKEMNGILQSIASKDMSIKDNDLSVETKDCISDQKPCSSKSIQFESISSEEVMETCREMNKQNRIANQTTDQMMTDCMELLRLFGIPYIVSPMEAEAQCAALELMGLTDGTITDDSDILLFGAQNVYKNFFTQSKLVLHFKADDIESRFNFSRSSLICFAMLCGSDYTDGVDGVGAVTALEILGEFKNEAKDDKNGVNGLKPLIDFKDWWKSKHNSRDKRPENTIRAKLLKLRLNESFPNSVIFDAYMNPIVDKSNEKFVWGMPSLDELRQYTCAHFGWTKDKTDSILLPVLKKVNEKQTQMTIDSYFRIQVQPKDTSLVSKRMGKAIQKLTGIESNPQTSRSNTKTMSALNEKVRNQRKRRQTKGGKSIGNTKGVQKHKRLAKPTPQEIDLSESSEQSDN